jgi:hypothetical protein
MLVRVYLQSLVDLRNCKLLNWMEQSPEQMNVVHLAKELSAFYGTRRFILVLSWFRWTQFPSSHPVSLRYVLILSFHLRLELTVVASLQVCDCIFYLSRATWSSHLSLLDLITLIIGYKLQSTNYDAPYYAFPSASFYSNSLRSVHFPQHLFLK